MLYAPHQRPQGVTNSEGAKAANIAANAIKFKHDPCCDDAHMVLDRLAPELPYRQPRALHGTGSRRDATLP